MGFFYEQKDVDEQRNVEARRKRTEKNVALVDQLRSAAKQGCPACPLDKARLEHPKMPPTGAKEPVVYILGEAPGADEDEEGEQFIGKSGQLLRSLIPPKYAKRFRWNNTIRCRPPQNRDPEPIETECCRPLQAHDIEQSEPLAVFGFGLFPLKWATGMKNPQMVSWRGRRLPVQFGKHTCWYYVLQHPEFILRTKNDRAHGGDAQEEVFRWDVQAAIRDAFEGKLPEPRVVPKAERSAGIRTPMLKYEDLDRALTEAERWPELGIDIETNGLRPYFRERKILTLSVSNGPDTIAFPYQHPGGDWGAAMPKVRRRVREFLLRSGRKWAHQLNFEMEWLAEELGEEVLWGTTWGDTLAQAYILDERGDERDGVKSLGDLTLINFGFDVKAESSVDTKRLAEEPIGKVLLYNGMDARWCIELARAQGTRLTEAGLQQVYVEQARRSAPIVMAQRRGLVPNYSAVKKLESTWQARYEKARGALLGDRDVKRWEKTRGKPFVAADKIVPAAQTLIAFFEFIRLKHKLRVPGREERYSTEEDVLAQVDHPVAKAVPELRHASKMLSTYIRPMLPGGSMLHEDGFVHPLFNHCRTSTRRLSSEDPNGQNFPKRENREIREVICAPGAESA